MSTVRRLLDLSTNNLPQSIMDDLAGLDGVVAWPTEYGALMWVPDDPDDPEVSADPDDDATESNVPAEVLVIWRHARALGCDYVLFDRDADTDDALSSWEW